MIGHVAEAAETGVSVSGYGSGARLAIRQLILEFAERAAVRATLSLRIVMRERGDAWKTVAVTPCKSIARDRVNQHVTIDLHRADRNGAGLAEHDVVEVRRAGIRAGVLIALDVDAIEVDCIEGSLPEVD